jgi:hypothetical protein
MAIEIQASQSMAEKIPYSCEVTNLPAGVTLVSGTATHIPPEGSATTPTITIVGSVAIVYFGPLSVKNAHELRVLLTYSDGSKYEFKHNVQVNF